MILYYIYTVVATLTVIASWDLHGTPGRVLMVIAAGAPTFVKMFNYEPTFKTYTPPERYESIEPFNFYTGEGTSPYSDGCTDPKSSSRKAESFLSDFYEWCDENGYSQEERPLVFQEWVNEN